MTPVRIVKTARFKRIVISRSSAADEEKHPVRSGFTGTGSYTLWHPAALYYGWSSHASSKLTDANYLDISTGSITIIFDTHQPQSLRTNAQSLRCLAIE